MTQTSSVRGLKGAYEAVTVATFTAVSAATDDVANASTAVKLPIADAYAFILNVTSAAVGADDTCDVYVQTLLDGTNWVDVVHFTQILGNGGAKRYVTKIVNQTATAEFENGTALGAAAVRNLIGDAWRVYCLVVDGGAATAEAFTFTVKAIPM